MSEQNENLDSELTSYSLDDEDQLPVVVAVLDRDVDAVVGHGPSELAQLTRSGLVQTQQLALETPPTVSR